MGWKIQLDRPDSPCQDDEAYSTGICIRNKFIEETNSPELSKHCKNPCIPPHLVIISQKQLFIYRVILIVIIILKSSVPTQRLLI